jgi:L-glutamine-phosphate cytidylyltransferase
MKAIILAAGLGSRLLPLTADRPKCLVTVGERTILEHQLTALHSAGVSDVTVVGGYRFDRLTEFVAGLPEALRPALVYNPFYAVSSSIGSVWAVRGLLDGPFLLLNGDTVYESDLMSEALGRLPGGVSLFIEEAVDPEHDDMRVVARENRVLEVGKELSLRRARHRSLGIVACSDADGGGYADALHQVIASQGGEHRFHHDVVDLLARTTGVAAVTFEAGTWREIDSVADIDRWLGPDGIEDSEAA